MPSNVFLLQWKSCEFESRSWRSVLDKTLCDKVGRWLASDRWFSPGTPVSSTNETDCHDITEEFEDTKWVIRIRISKKNRQHNGQKVQKDKQRYIVENSVKPISLTPYNGRTTASLNLFPQSLTFSQEGNSFMDGSTPQQIKYAFIYKAVPLFLLILFY